MKTYEKPVVEIVNFEITDSVMDVPSTSDGVNPWSIE